MIIAVAALAVVALIAGVVHEVRHDGLVRRPYDPTYNSRVSN